MDGVYGWRIWMAYMDNRDRSGHYEVRCAMKARVAVTGFSLQLEHRDWMRFRCQTCVCVSFEHTVVMG
jgi:hypothetical protein